MDWTKPFTSLTLFETNKTNAKGTSKRPGSDLEERESGSICVTPGERRRQSLRKQTKNKVARRGSDGKEMQKKSLQGQLPGRETPDFFFLTAHEHVESFFVRFCRT